MKNDHCRRTSTNRMALANGIRDATVTYMLSTNATPFVKLLVWLLRSITPILYGISINS